LAAALLFSRAVDLYVPAAGRTGLQLSGEHVRGDREGRWVVEKNKQPVRIRSPKSEELREAVSNDPRIHAGIHGRPQLKHPCNVLILDAVPGEEIKRHAPVQGTNVESWHRTKIEYPGRTSIGEDFTKVARRDRRHIDQPNE